MSLKDQIIDAGKELASSGESASQIVPVGSTNPSREITAANAELAALGVSSSWGTDEDGFVVNLVKGAVPPAPAPEPAPEPEPEPSDETPEDPKPSKWSFGDTH
tara:strand:+ start:4491 stop:4802 length:312 start_codon:yes stop_codon:yes gene_type:complete